MLYLNIFRRRSGQSVVMAMLMAVLLLGIVPIIISFIRREGTHQIASQKRDKAEAIAEEGIAYAAKLLSTNQVTWNSAIQTDTPPGGLPVDSFGPLIASPSGGQFKIMCSHPAILPANLLNLQPYEENVVAVAYLPSSPGSGGAFEPIRAKQAYFSQRTFGTRLTTGESASAALSLVVQPDFTTAPYTGTLRVDWGPIMCLDAQQLTPWQLKDTLDQYPAGSGNPGFPRKYSQGAITGTPPTAPLTVRTPDCSVTGVTFSDHKEYWACASQSAPPPLVNLIGITPGMEGYQWQAQNKTNATVTPISEASLPGVVPILPFGCAAANTTCGNYNVAAGDTASFAAGSLTPNATTYVNGNVELKTVGNNVSLIVIGNLILDNPGGGLAASSIRVPPTAPLEYTYWPAAPAPQWPCKAFVGTYCPAALAPNGGVLQFSGFIYVTGNLIVKSPYVWNIDGMVSVGDISANPPTGRLRIENGATLNLFYNDLVSHNILVNPIGTTNSIDMQTDLQRDIPLP